MSPRRHAANGSFRSATDQGGFRDVVPFPFDVWIGLPCRMEHRRRFVCPASIHDSANGAGARPMSCRDVQGRIWIRDFGHVESDLPGKQRVRKDEARFKNNRVCR
jgi:hypothetical protein